VLITAGSAHQPILSSRPVGYPGASAGAILAGPHPNVPFVHEFDLPVYHLAPVVLVPVGGPPSGLRMNPTLKNRPGNSG